MTSFSKALYRRDPAAAEAFHRQQAFEHRHTYGRTPTLPQFTLAFHERKPVFGQRPMPTLGQAACQHNCGHPGCTSGCTGSGR